jgi:hypothetical protein
MDLPAPCNEYVRHVLARPAFSRVADTETSASSPALRHYERAIQALVGTTYDGLSRAERRQLLALLCRERQQLVDDANDPR